MSIILDRPSATAEDRRLRTDLVERAAKLVPLLAANAKRAEDERRVPEENIRLIEEAGLFTIMQPRRFGGLEVDFRTKLEVTRELARGCGSTAWATSLMNVCAWFTGLWGAQAQEDVWGENPRNRVAGVFAPSATARVVEGGLVVTGKWGWASGCLHSQWALVGTPAVEGEGKSYDQGMVLIPMSELTIEDTWFVVGMRGTGSNTLVADEVFVPEHRFISVPKMTLGEVATPFKDEALYRSAFVPGAAIILVGPQLGLAQAALDLVLEKAPKRGISYTFYDNQTKAPVVQLAVAKAASLIDTAHLLAYRAAAEIDENAHNSVFPDYTARAKARMDVGQAIVTAREAIRELVTAHGASSFAESSPMQRIWRDSEVASRHAVGNPEISAEVYGRALLGIHEGVSPLV
ncbi:MULTISPECIES: acyl-CoA dehydrogenase family protein [unclassified Amycolatopsis]|uniref:acyl-CoA dehydrogenase family protein n=1 Tax=unclassified Amycolatopsis TaxID=2618356 RepID=UPI001C69E216|nr:acyl-CoA dehydrogenase family protein [Amycolatopsis sp. DSM 110486]QYN20228.1 acyl-CoA dehydrogenase family protein [Amycolatopsis sp. DSM 110486]